MIKKLCSILFMSIFSLHGAADTPRSYVEQLNAKREAEYTAHCKKSADDNHAIFLKELARFFALTDRRYMVPARLSTQCLKEGNTSACIELEKTVNAIFEEAQSTCELNLRRARYLAAEIDAIDQLARSSSHCRLKQDKKRLEEELNAHLTSSDCHLCSSLEDCNILLFAKYRCNNNFAPNRNDPEYIADLLIARTIRQEFGHKTKAWIESSDSAPFSYILRLASHIKNKPTEPALASVRIKMPRKTQAYSWNGLKEDSW